MWSDTWHNINANLLNCDMNIQIRKIQEKSSYWHKNNNTSSILTKQSCLLKISWPKKVIPTKSYSPAMLYLHHIKYLNHAQPRWQAKQLFHTPTFSKLFQSSPNTWAWAMDIALCGIEGWLWRRQKREDLTSTMLINGLWRCPTIDVNARSRDCHATDALEL